MTLVTWLKKILAGLGVIWLILVISVMISLFGLRMYAQGDTVQGRRWLRVSSPVSLIFSRATWRAVPLIERWYLLHTLLLGSDRYLVLLQNTDEIRATGGFIGSYTVLDFGSSEPLRLTIHDMYDPSGMSMTLPSPPGQREYLSEGKGLKLVDANWSPDFPTSAAQILQYFENIQGDPQRYDGIIALTLPTIEQLVETLGGLYLADQQHTVTGENLAVLMREDRGEFFAGSQEKEQSLQSFYTALKLRLAELTWDEWRQIFRALESNLALELQLFAHNDQTQRSIETARLDGSIQSFQSNEIFIFPVESNVGINKANRKVTRQLTARVQDQQLGVTTIFYNAFTANERPIIPAESSYAVAPHLSYVNYYRLLVRPDMAIETIRVDDQPIAQWDEDSIMSSSGGQYKQIGFLVVVPEESTVIVEAQFSLPELRKPKLIIQRQVGLEYQSITESIE